MYSIELSENITISNELLNVDELFPHEEVVNERMEKLVLYLTSLKPYIIIPSILICSKSNMIIDGHHRYYALQKLGFEKVPITKINYESDLIKTHIESNISKEDLLYAAINRKMLPPKSSFHHIMDVNYKLQPIILLSVLTRLDYL
jgi:ParB-like chromosome segregation protein Spo0J